MADLQLDWSSAEVSQGKLSVSLDEKPTKEWRASFERTVQLLDHGTWPDVELSKGTVTVSGVEPGSEEKLRFFLDSAVQEANGEQSDEDDEQEGQGEDTEAASKKDEDDPDREMTDRFRAFAPEQTEPDDSSDG